MSAEEGDDKIPKRFSITLFAAMVLYFNLYRARKSVGYSDPEHRFADLDKMLKNTKISLSRDEVESLLWNSVILHEQNEFWHPEDVTIDEFIRQVVRWVQHRVYFDKFYNFFRGLKPKKKVVINNIVSSEDTKK